MFRTRSFCALAVLTFCAVAAGQAQHSQTLEERGKDSFEADFPSGGTLRMDIRSSGVTIEGTADNKIHVWLKPRRAGDVGDARIRFKSSGNQGDLRITGGPDNNFRIEIQIPQNTNLEFQMFAGQLDLFGVSGNKDVDVRAGQVNIRMGRPDEYARVEASVLSGEVQARPYNVVKGGLFRTFKKLGPGRSNLYAHVGAGQITLE